MQEDDDCDYDGNNSENEEKEVVPTKQTRLDSPEPAHDEQAHLKKELNNLLLGLELLPKRKIGESSSGVAPHITCTFCGLIGVHYSDSCPEITDGDARWHFVCDRGLCSHCLERFDPRRECWSKKKKCWHCSIVRNTILRFLILNDGGHHRALCNIPNSGMKIRERIQEIKQQLSDH